MSPENMSGRFCGGKYGIFEANTLNMWNFTDLNRLKREGKKGSNYLSDRIKYKDITKITSQGEIRLNDFDILKKEGKKRSKLFEEGEVYCSGEVDYWKASG